MSTDAPAPFRPRRILRALADHDVEFLIIGGLAAGAHGVARATGDVDILMRPEHANFERLANAFSTDLAPAEAVWDTGFVDIDPTEASDLHRGTNYRVRTPFGLLDVLNRPTGVPPFEDLDDDAVTARVAGVEVRIIGRDHLIAMKRAAGRPKDLGDIAELTALEQGPADDAS